MRRLSTALVFLMLLASAIELHAQVASETNTYKTATQRGRDYGTYAYTVIKVEQTDAPARSDDPHCLNGTLLGIPTHRGSNCQRLCMVIPPGREPDRSRVVLLAGNSDATSAMLQCSGHCSIGWSKWYEGPTWDATGTEVCATFKNWSHTLTRWAGIKAFYVGAPPPEPPAASAIETPNPAPPAARPRRDEPSGVGDRR